MEQPLKLLGLPKTMRKVESAGCTRLYGGEGLSLSHRLSRQSREPWGFAFSVTVILSPGGFAQG